MMQSRDQIALVLVSLVGLVLIKSCKCLLYADFDGELDKFGHVRRISTSFDDRRPISTNVDKFRPV